MGEGQYWPKGICLQNTHVWKIPNEINFISEMPISLTVLFFCSLFSLEGVSIYWYLYQVRC